MSIDVIYIKKVSTSTYLLKKKIKYLHNDRSAF